jgi:hypothetical protein
MQKYTGVFENFSSKEPLSQKKKAKVYRTSFRRLEGFSHISKIANYLMIVTKIFAKAFEYENINVIHILTI